MAPGLAAVQGRRLTRECARHAVRASGRPRSRFLWPALALPGAIWLLLLFVAPLYVVLAIVFGGVDPIFRTPVPVWNPVEWNTAQFSDVFRHIFGDDGYFGPRAGPDRGLRAAPRARCAC